MTTTVQIHMTGANARLAAELIAQARRDAADAGDIDTEMRCNLILNALDFALSRAAA